MERLEPGSLTQLLSQSLFHSITLDQLGQRGDCGRGIGHPGSGYLRVCRGLNNASLLLSKRKVTTFLIRAGGPHNGDGESPCCHCFFVLWHPNEGKLLGRYPATHFLSQILSCPRASATRVSVQKSWCPEGSLGGPWAECSQEEAYPTIQALQAVPMVSLPITASEDPTRTLPEC